MSFEKEFPIPHGNRDSWSSMTNGMSIPQENGIGCGSGIELVGYGDPTMAQRRSMPMDNGTVSNMDSWNSTTESTILQSNGISQSSSSWIPVTSEQQINERINSVPVEMQEPQSETENWHDLLGMYTDLLQEKPADQPPVHNNGNQNWLASITNSNLTQTPNPVPYQNHTSNQPSIYYTSLTSMPGSQQTQRFTSTDVINNGHSSKDGFTINYGPHYSSDSPPRLKPDHIIDSFPFAPITPGNQIKHMSGQRVQEKVTILDEETSARTENENANDAVSMKDAENLYNELLQTIENSPPSAVSTTQKDCLVSEDKDEQASELQKTPNQKTPSRRKKHRPKVIREGKAKRTPKDPKTGTPGEIRVKRKYVKRKGVNNPNENTPVETVQKRKCVRRKGVNGEKTPAENVQKRKYVRKKGVDQSESQPQSTVDDTPPKSCKKQLNFDLENMTQDEGCDNKSSQPDITVPSTPHVKPSYHGLNVLARNMTTGLKQEGVVNEHGMTVDDTPPKSCKKQLNFDLENMTQDEGHDNIIVPSTPLVKPSYHGLNVLARNMATSLKQDRVINENGIKNDVFQHTPQTFKSEGMVSLDERRGIKRQSCEQMNYNANAMNSLLMYQKMLLGVANRAYNSNHLGTILFENRKKMKMQSELLDNSRQMQGVYGNGSAMGLLNSSTGRIDPSCKVINIGGNGSGHRFWRPMSATHYLLKRQLSNGLPPHMMRSMPGRLQNYSRGTMISWNKPSPIPTKGAFRNAVTTYPKFGPNSYNQRVNGLREMLQQHRNNSLKSYQKPSKAPRGRPRKQKVEDPVDIITRGLQRLQIYDGNRVQQNELVLYKGSEAMIPFVPIKKRNQRPKVDLDPESERLWNLLMGNEESNGAEKHDDDKEKWWENERRVFSGRTDSFIARMHLVQGDRRFSRWKGSVVDSVIGVFLTQNVSDHLSSSAFMSLAAKFPVKSTAHNKTCCQDDIPTCHEKNPTFTNSPENMTHLISSPRDAENNHLKISEEEVIPSQESFDSSTIQAVDECGSSAGSNSEDHSFNDDLATNMHHPPEEPASNIQVPETNDINLNSPSSQFQTGITSGLPSSNSGVTDAYHTSNVTSPQSETPKFQTPPQGQYNLPSSHPSQPLDTTMLRGIPVISVEDRVSVANKQNCFEDTVTEANSKKQDASRAPTSGPGPNVPKAKKETPEDGRKTTIDWDSLRKQALSNSEKKERSKDAYDTMDYEALRRASVNEISDVIKERGMNNLLADRMKDFLNRLVRDHGSVDLEWLRDAPPDKAKDYLLSFRGLGLKSVECIRLLTLHHLAFPVDTNVGRIAVRLGWVPLQPLPESLQLHLLEMYPVLESIQKYLWPRLCKLDQLTLYELHYQMITFGKVFCTKSKPNCNACPMRAECRHFASAFASARLALPGPEEKRIVPSDAPVTTDPMPPPVVIRPMPLPPAENESNESAEISRNTCEPIIEEPTTPEPETNELSISDIEDQYYEDSDEIPSIKLNMEEFTTNLQNIMQDSNDLSKALVALTPKAASIPMPKLKDVSRLRTEHLVYELPDSHQLLEGLDKREPDDPSPYLLAIWTPGETANSAQAPTTDCSAQKSGQLCDQTTCFSCNSVKEANSQVVRGTILIPCRTAMRGSFPLNGTYFQVNEMFADHASSLNPIDVPRTWIWNLPRRKVYFGTSVSTIFKGLSTEGIQYCFWKGFVCVRGFDRINRAPRPLMARLHFPASKLIAQRTKANK